MKSLKDEIMWVGAQTNLLEIYLKGLCFILECTAANGFKCILYGRNANQRATYICTEMYSMLQVSEFT